MNPKDEPKKIGYYLERTTRIVKLSYLQAFANLGVDITPEQWVILDSLYQRNGQSQTELAGDSFKNAPTVSRILDLLERKELIERQRFNNDRRRYKIFLTDKGKLIVEKIQPAVTALRHQGWQNLSDEDYLVFLRIINQVFDNLDGTG
ncbi:MAG: MarR family transcriptional regulator [Saprospiraceae bacterium]